MCRGISLLLFRNRKLAERPGYRSGCFMFQASLPDEHGYCSCGLNADFIREGVETADRVIMQVNAHMPRNAGIDSLVHVSEADRIVRCDEPMPAVPRTEITEIERKIGENCAALVEDGSTIQIGIGSIPDAVCQALMGKKNLGVHSEMISDGIMDLCRAGSSQIRRNPMRSERW